MGLNAFLASLLAAIWPFIQQALQALFDLLMGKLKNNAAAQAILSGVKSVDELHKAMPQVIDTVASDPAFSGSRFKRKRFDRLRRRLQHPTAAKAMWDHMVTMGAVEGQLTGVGFADVADAMTYCDDDDPAGAVGDAGPEDAAAAK